MTNNGPSTPKIDVLFQRLDAQMPLPDGNWNSSTTIEHLDSLSNLRLLLTLGEELDADFTNAIQALNDRTTIGDLVAAMLKSAT